MIPLILYNLPYRGPFEYDKMVLNALQFHNRALSGVDELYGQKALINPYSLNTERAQSVIDKAYLNAQSTY